MSKNDDRILELKKQIETKKKSISEKKIRLFLKQIAFLIWME